MVGNSEVEVTWQGLDELKARFSSLSAKLQVRAIRNGLSAGARVVRDAAKAKTPVLRTPDPRRKPGTVRDAIRVRTSKIAKREGNIGVFINVKPLTRAQVAKFKASAGRKGAANPNDPYYWSWLNWGRAGRAGEAARAGSFQFRGGKRRLIRGRGARRAVAPMPGAHFLEEGVKQLPRALLAIQQAMAPAVQRILDRQADQ